MERQSLRRNLARSNLTKTPLTGCLIGEWSSGKTAKVFDICPLRDGGSIPSSPMFEVIMKGSEKYKETVREYYINHTARECAEYFGISLQVVYKTAAELGVCCKRRRGPIDKSLLRAHELAYKISHEEKSLEEIGKETGISKQRVHQILKRCGYKQVWVSPTEYEMIFGKEEA